MRFSIDIAAVARRLVWIARCSGVAMAFTLPLSTSLLSILGVLTVGLSLWVSLWSKPWREEILAYFRQPVVQILCLLFVGLLLGATYSAAPSQDIQHILLKYSKFLLFVFLLPLFEPKMVRQCAIYAFLAGVFVIVLLICSHAWGIQPIEYNALISKSRIEVGFVMAFAAYLLACLCWQQPQYRWLWGIMWVLTVIALLFLNQGRSGYVIFFVLSLLFLWWRFGWRATVLGLFGVVVLVMAAYTWSADFNMRTDQVKRDIVLYQQGVATTSIGQRISFVKNSLTLIKQRYLFGFGTGSFASEYVKVEDNHRLQTANPHNEFLNIMVQLGIMGLAILLLIFYIPWKYSVFLPAHEQYLARGIILAIFVGCFANSWLMDITESYAYLYFLVLAFANQSHCVLQRVLSQAKASGGGAYLSRRHRGVVW